MLYCTVHDAATNTLWIQYPHSVFGVSEGQRAAAVSRHHLLSLQVNAESLINTPSQGESPITPLFSNCIYIPLSHVSNHDCCQPVSTFHSTSFFTFSLQTNVTSWHSRKIKRCTYVSISGTDADSLSDTDKQWQIRNWQIWEKFSPLSKLKHNYSV